MENRDQTTENDSQEKEEYFEYTEEFMYQLLGELIRNDAFAKRYMPVLKAGYFKKRKLPKVIFEVLQSHYERFGVMPKASTTFFDHIVDMKRIDKDFIQNEKFNDMIREIYDENFDTNSVVTVARTKGYIKKERVMQALLKMGNDWSNQKYELMPDRLTKAMSAGIFEDVPLDIYLENKFTVDSQRIGLLSLNFNRLKTFGLHTRGLQSGLYIISAETSTGKTNFLSNIVIDLLQSNQDTKCVYFSLDDNRNTVINRFLSVITGFGIPSVQSQQPTTENHLTLKKAYDELIQYSRDSRLFIYDISQIQNLQTLENIIKMKLDKNLVVAIDGLYNAEIEGTERVSMREENIQRANRVKKIADIYDIPVITTGELRKKQKKTDTDISPTMDDLMESGKYAYNASVVILLYPQARATFECDPHYIVVARFAKNKISGFIGQQDILVRRSVARMDELIEGQQIRKAPSYEEYMESRKKV